MRFKIIILSFLSLSLSKANARTIKGKVLDFTSGKAISMVFVSIKHQDKNKTCLTDINGKFSIEVWDNTDTISFNHLGYEPQKICIGGRKNLKIFLQLKPYLLDEVVVVAPKSVSARDIIKKVEANLNNCIINKSYQAVGHEIKYRKRNGKYVFFAEGIFDFYSSGYSKKGHSYSFVKPLQYRISDHELSYTSVGPSNWLFPYLNVHYDNILIPVILNNGFKYFISDTIIKKGITYLLVNFKIDNDAVKDVKKTNPKFCFYTDYYQYGNILINLDRYIPVQITCKGKALKSFHNKAEYISNSKFSLLKGSYVLTEKEFYYAYLEKSPFDDSFDSFLINSKCKFNKIDTTYLSNEQLENRFNCKVKIDNYAGTSVRYLSRVSHTSDKVSKYDSTYWNVANEQLESKIKTDLKELSGIDIEQQFLNNSEYLIKKQDIMTLIKHSDIEMRKELIRTNKGLKRGSLFK